MFNKFIGTKKFYRHVMMIVLPIMVQNAISNFVNLLDNIMVGQVGTAEMSGVSIVNQLFFIYYLCIFGGLSGAGIFTAQYFGQGDNNGIKHTFRYKFWVGAIVFSIAMIVFYAFGPNLISLYLNGENAGGDLTKALEHGSAYMRISAIGLLPVMIVNVYAGTLRDCGKTTLPMIASICAVFINLILDWLLIFGHFGLPKMGVEGAALATVIARFIEMFIVVIYCHRNTEKLPYIKGVYKTLLVPKENVKEYFLRGMPLMLNETLWSAGMAMIMQCYSTRGLEAVAAINIGNTISNVLNVVFFAMGDAVAIIVGQLLGAGNMKEARDTDTKIIAMSFASGLFVSIVLVFLSGFFPNFYNTSDSVKKLASNVILLQACFAPFMALLHSTYFTLRSGGKTVITFIFDSGFLWVISFPVAFCLARFTAAPLVVLILVDNTINLFKTGFGLYLVKKGGWMQTITV